MPAPFPSDQNQTPTWYSAQRSVTAESSFDAASRLSSSGTASAGFLHDTHQKMGGAIFGLILEQSAQGPKSFLQLSGIRQSLRLLLPTLLVETGPVSQHDAPVALTVPIGVDEAAVLGGEGDSSWSLSSGRVREQHAYQQGCDSQFDLYLGSHPNREPRLRRAPTT